MSGVPPPLVRGAYNTLASLTVHVAVFDLVVLIEPLYTVPITKIPCCPLARRVAWSTTVCIVCLLMVPGVADP